MKRLTLLFLFFSLINLTEAQVPGTLSYQGLLVKSDGTPATDGDHTVKFDFFTVATAGTAVLSRGPFTVTTYKGMFTFILGSGTPTGNTTLPEALGASQHYIEVTADGVALTPRAQLTTVPYAIKAQSANMMDAAGLTGAIKVSGSNVGIGTTTPIATLQVARGTGVNGTAAFHGTTNISHFNYDAAEDTYIRGGKATSKVFLNDNSSGNVLIAGGGGNVGIGTASPADKLHISNGDLQISNTTTNASLILNSPDVAAKSNQILFRKNNVSQWALGGGNIGFAGASDFSLYSYGLSRNILTVLNSNGNVGIGTVTPQDLLHISSTTPNLIIEASGTTASDASILFKSNFSLLGNTDNITAKILGAPSDSYGGRIIMSTADYTTGALIDRVYINAYGNVGIGTNAPSQRLHVIGNILASGTVTPSDSRLKKNVTDLNYGLIEVMKLRPVSYIMKDNLEERRDLGLIAQETLLITPEIVITPKNKDEFYAMNYTQLIPVLIKAIQEQQAQINELKLSNSGLKAELDQYKELSAQIEVLKRRMDQREGTLVSGSSKK